MTKEVVLLTGVPASPGRVKGKVFRILNPDQVANMEEGCVLVATETTPEFTVAIMKASAIVTDRGGILSHPAIVAREMGIPGVVGTQEATKKLLDGMEIIVDGTEGKVLRESN